MVMAMNWQDVLAIALACACGTWVVWVTLRPFVRKVASACGMCSGCGPAGDSAASQSDLLQIAPSDAG